MIEQRLELSVIIPVYNGERTLDACLNALLGQKQDWQEIIVVDDGSTDHSPDIAKCYGVRLVSIKHQGDALARNIGAKMAQSDILLFLDSDVLITEQTLSKILDHFQHPEIKAVVGAYTPFTPIQSLIARYKNALHHFTHLHAPKDFPSFWTGCGAIRRDVFEELGAFNPQFAPISDVHFGVRLRKKGFLVRLDPSIQVTHFKPYTLWKLFCSDLFGRSVPWIQIMLNERVWIKGLNTDVRQIFSLFIVYLWIWMSMFFMLGYPLSRMDSGIVLLGLPGLFYLCHVEFLSFFRSHYGAKNTLGASMIHALSFLSQGIGLTIGVMRYIRSKGKLTF